MGGWRAGGYCVSQFLNLLVAGLTSGAIYGIFGACLAVWFRVCNILNLAVGDFAMLGAIGTAWLAQNAGLPFIASIVADLAGVALAAWLFNWVVLHPAFDRSRGARGIVGVFFYTFGLSLVLEGVARAWFGTDVWGAPTIWAGPSLSVFDFHVQRAGILVIVLTPVSGARTVGVPALHGVRAGRERLRRERARVPDHRNRQREVPAADLHRDRSARRAVRHRRVASCPGFTSSAGRRSA